MQFISEGCSGDARSCHEERVLTIAVHSTSVDVHVNGSIVKSLGILLVLLACVSGTGNAANSRISAACYRLSRFNKHFSSSDAAGYVLPVMIILEACANTLQHPPTMT
jgi:hypothetical protein